MIKAVDAKINQNTVKYLEGLLELVKSGEVIGVASVSLFTGGDTGSGWSDIEKNGELVIGELAILQGRLVNQIIRNNHHDEVEN